MDWTEMLAHGRFCWVSVVDAADDEDVGEDGTGRGGGGMALEDEVGEL